MLNFILQIRIPDFPHFIANTNFSDQSMFRYNLNNMSYDNDKDSGSKYLKGSYNHEYDTSYNLNVEQSCSMNGETDSDASQHVDATPDRVSRDLNCNKLQAVSPNKILKSLATAQPVETREDDKPSFDEGFSSPLIRRTGAMSVTDTKVTLTVDDTGDISSKEMRKRKRGSECIGVPPVS